MQRPHREPNAHMATVLRKLQEEPETLEIEIDACSPRCAIPQELGRKGHAVRVRMREQEDQGWVTADRTMRERRALLHHENAAAETWSTEHVERLTRLCLETAGKRPPAPAVALLLEIAERLDARQLALTTRSEGHEARTRRRGREELLNVLLGQTWPTNALRSGIAWALPVDGEHGVEWLSLKSEGAPSVHRGRQTINLDTEEIQALDWLARELLQRSWNRPMGRWTRRDGEYVLRVGRSRRDGR